MNEQSGNSGTPGGNDAPLGESYIRYYRPILLKKKGHELDALAQQPLTHSYPHQITPAEAESQTEQAVLLARELFKLVMREWEPDANVYLSLLDRYIEPLSVEQTYALLAETRESFRSQFGKMIKERGESIELLDQIVKRTGKPTRPQIEKIITGIEVPKLARELWQLFDPPVPILPETLAPKLEDYTNKQVLALRSEFNRLPARLLAERLSECLTPYSLSQDERKMDMETLREIMSRGTTHEETKDLFEVDAIAYALRGRPRSEIELIEYYFASEISADRPEGATTLPDCIIEALEDHEEQYLQTLLLGFDAHYFVERVERIFAGWRPGLPSKVAVDVGSWTTVGHVTISEGLSTTFPKRYAFRQDLAGWERELEVRDQVNRHLRALSSEQFTAVQAQLNQGVGLTLTPQFYPWLVSVDPRQRAEAVLDSLELSLNIEDLLDPIEYLLPAELLEVSQIFEVVSNQNFEQVLGAAARELLAVKTNDLFDRFLEDRLTGRLRRPITADLLAPFIEEKCAVPLPEQISQAFIEALEVGDSIKMREALTQLDAKQRKELESWAFTKRGTALLQEVKGKLSPTEFDLIAELLAGFDPVSFADKAQKLPATLLELLDSSPRRVRAVINAIEAKTGAGPFDLLAGEWAEHFSPEETRKLSVIFLAPQTRELRALLVRCRREDATALPEILALFATLRGKMVPFERSYHRLFGDLRLHLKELLSEEALTTAAFVEIILRLEELDTGLVSEIEGYIKEDSTADLQRLFRKHRTDLDTLRESFDLLHQDSGLRTTINRMNAHLYQINRTILFLDRFYPDIVADELVELVQRFSGTELETAIAAVLAHPNDAPQQYRIPADPNWLGEMYHQVRCEYEVRRKNALVNDLREAGVAEKILETIAVQLYGPHSHSKLEEALESIAVDKPGSAEEKEAHFIKVIKECPVPLREHIFELGSILVTPGTGVSRLTQALDLLSVENQAKIDKWREEARQALHVQVIDDELQSSEDL